LPSALSLSHCYSHLSYFAHALEILLHNVLDEAVDRQSRDEQRGDLPEGSPSLLPSVISFLQASLPADVFLDIVVQCTRKNEIRSWQTLFSHLPPPKDLFEQALRLKSLKTAAGYLLVLQALDEEEDGSESRIEDYAVRLLGLASQKGDWDLCAELARFLIALDSSGDLLRRTIERVGVRHTATAQKSGAAGANGPGMKGLGLSLPIPSTPSSLSPHRMHRRQRKGSDISSATSGGGTGTGTAGTSPVRSSISRADDDDDADMAATTSEGRSVSPGGSSGVDEYSSGPFSPTA
jgi:hypothetical protein